MAMPSRVRYSAGVTAADTAPVAEIGDNEHDPLLPEPARKATPLPLRQIGFLCLLQVSEALIFYVTTPFTPKLVVEIGAGKGDETKAGILVGILSSGFFVAEGLMTFSWGRISDSIGRKPVLAIQMTGIATCALGYGLSKTFAGLLISRVGYGLFNGESSIIRSMIWELTDSTNISQALSLNMVAFGTGGIIGPLIGGLLAHPSERFPSLFGNSAFLKAYPYFLPCSLPAVFAFFVTWLTQVYLKETVANPNTPYRVSVSTSRVSEQVERPGDISPPPLKAFLTTRFFVSTLSFTMIALVSVSAKGLLPVFFTTSIRHQGLGFDTSTTGICLALVGISTTSMQLILFRRTHDLMGDRGVCLFGALAYIPMIALCPTESYLARTFGHLHWTVCICLGVQFVLLAFGHMAGACIFVYIAAASPDARSIGATAGLAQAAVSFMRAVGPSLSGSLYSYTIRSNAMGGWLIWYALWCIAALTFTSELLLPRRPWARAA